MASFWPGNWTGTGLLGVDPHENDGGANFFEHCPSKFSGFLEHFMG
jgi:hypothetical protein